MPSTRQIISEEEYKILGRDLFSLYSKILQPYSRRYSNPCENTYTGASNDPTQNPIVQVPIVCIYHEGEVYVDTITSDEYLNNLATQGDNNIGTLNNHPIRD